YSVVVVFVFRFFFSSRRRHTRFSRDWSSDVCSSDLGILEHADAVQARQLAAHGFDVLRMAGGLDDREAGLGVGGDPLDLAGGGEIGRASCRERVKSREVAVS